MHIIQFSCIFQIDLQVKIDLASQIFSNVVVVVCFSLECIKNKYQFLGQIMDRLSIPLGYRPLKWGARVLCFSPYIFLPSNIKYGHLPDSIHNCSSNFPICTIFFSPYLVKKISNQVFIIH